MSGLKAVILAGGFGKRLRPLTDSTPKPLLEVGGKAILEWQVEWLKRQGVSAVILCVGYMKEKFFEVVGGGSSLGVRVYYSVEDEPLGTGGALKVARHLLEGEEAFLVLNGDILTNLDVRPLLEALRGAVGSIALVPLPCPYGVVETSGNRVASFAEKPVLRDYWINAGVYAFTPEVFDYLPDKGDLERSALPRLALHGSLVAVKYEDVVWKSIDTHKDLEEAGKTVVPVLKSSFSNKYSSQQSGDG